MDFKSWNDVPKEIRESMKNVGAAMMPLVGSKAVSFFCEDFCGFHGGGLHMTNVLVDASVFYQSVQLELKFCHLDTFTIGGSYAWSIRPLGLEEK